MIFLVRRIRLYCPIVADVTAGVLIQIREALQPDGFFLGALLGGDTLFELRQVNHSHVTKPY
jgi:NADH dehydrogenase [ubiquinone] 1 alpha subcomplex assembly factor 5